MTKASPLYNQNKKFYTDYPLNPKIPYDGAVNEIRVHGYDGNKYCWVQAIDPKIHDQAVPIKIGYVFADPEMKRRPSKKQVSVWQGQRRAEKSRQRKTDYCVMLDSEADFTVAKVALDVQRMEGAKHGKPKTLKAALLVARRFLLKNPSMVVMVGRNVHNGYSAYFNKDRIFVSLKNQRLRIEWKDSWNRNYRPRQKRDFTSLMEDWYHG